MNFDARSDGDTLAMAASWPRLCYWLIAPADSNGYTPFQGFGHEVAQPLFTRLIEILAVLPASLLEVLSTPVDIPTARAQIMPKCASIVGLTSFIGIQKHMELDGILQVVIAPPSVMDAARAAVTHSDTIFLGVTGENAVVGLEGYDGHPAQALDEALYAAWLRWATSVCPGECSDLSRRETWTQDELDDIVTGVTQPNRLLAKSLGVSPPIRGPINADDERAYERAIIDSAKQCTRAIGANCTEYVLYSPSMVRQLYEFDSGIWNRLMRGISARNVRKLLQKAVFRNTAYSGFQLHTDDLPTLHALGNDPVASALLTFRQRELRINAAAIGALATSLLAPALRLPNAVNFHRATLRDIEGFARRGDAVGRGRVQALFGNLSHRLREDIDGGIRSIFADPSLSLTLVSDAPVEWARIDGLPLMIRHEMSRISSTPGNLMLQQCLESSIVAIQDKELYDILIIRSFDANDPIREMLERGISLFKLERVRVRFVDVASVDEVVSSLNTFDGMLVVFDCHGDHGGEDGHGWLRIGRERLDTWSLANIARIPPIVVLSACSTFALAGSHASVGNGLLRSGARTVIGTFLPVDAVQSTAFVGRLLYRIDAFLPALRALGITSLTWRTFVSGFLRMSYATDILRFLRDEKGWISDDQYSDIGIDANMRINRFESGWYDRLMMRLAQVVNRDEADVRATIADDHPLMETLLYCQLGRPDAILLEVTPLDVTHYQQA